MLLWGWQARSGRALLAVVAVGFSLRGRVFGASYQFFAMVPDGFGGSPGERAMRCGRRLGRAFSLASRLHDAAPGLCCQAGDGARRAGGDFRGVDVHGGAAISEDRRTTRSD